MGYREYITSKNQEYKNASSKKNKSAIMHAVFSTFCFYERCKNTGLWNIAKVGLRNNKVKRDLGIKNIPAPKQEQPHSHLHPHSPPSPPPPPQHSNDTKEDTSLRSEMGRNKRSVGG